MADGAPTGVGQIHISARDLDASVRFYTEQLGLALLFTVPAQQMAFVQCGSTRLYLGRPEDESFRSSPILYLTVSDIDASVAAMRARGVEFFSEPHIVHSDDSMELWMAFTRDPDANAVALMEQRRV